MTRLNQDHNQMVSSKCGTTCRLSNMFGIVHYAGPDHSMGIESWES